MADRPNFRAFVLGAMPGTKHQIELRSGVSRATVIKWIRRMHKDHEIYIKKWIKHPRAGPDMPVYAIGNRPDAPNKLQKLTKRQIFERYVAKAEQDGRYDKVRARWSKRYWVQRMKAEGDTLINALFGKPNERLKAA